MKYFFFLTSFFLTTISFLCGEIIETNKFQEIIHYIHPETLVVVDIDDTLLIPSQTLGTDVWFSSRLEHYQQIKKDRLLALDRALADWEAVRHLTNVRIVEEGTDQIIYEMQKNNTALMGLTAQGLALATRTIMQLQSLSIDLSKTAPSSHDYYFMNGRTGALYRQGILFASGTSKGEALVKFFDAIGYSPKCVVFVDDRKSNLEDVKKSVESRGIRFIGLRYSYSDARVAAFCRDIADVQWTHSTLDHLLSDEEASLLLNLTLKQECSEV